MKLAGVWPSARLNRPCDDLAVDMPSWVPNRSLLRSFNEGNRKPVGVCWLPSPLLQLCVVQPAESEPSTSLSAV